MINEQDNDDYFPEYEIDDSPLPVQQYQPCHIPAQPLGTGWTWEQINNLSLSAFRDWYAAPAQLIDGTLLDPSRTVGWIKGPWQSRDVAHFVASSKMQSRIPPSYPLPAPASAPPPDMIPLHSRDYQDVDSYVNMESYGRNTQSHVPLVREVLEQISGPVIAPGDGWGIVKSLSPESISGDVYGTGPVVRELIGETLQRGGDVLPVVLSYVATFLTEGDKRMLEKRKGPVVLIDEWPVLLERPDLQSLSPNVVSYGLPIIQRNFQQDNTKIRQRLSYDFNLTAVLDGYHWADWGPSLYYMLRFRPDLKHSSGRPFIRDAIRHFGLLADDVKKIDATHFLASHINAPSSFFCPIGRVQKGAEPAYAKTNWLFSRTVYYGDDELYAYLPREQGYFYCPQEMKLRKGSVGISFLPRNFKIYYDGRLGREKESGEMLFTDGERSQVDFVRQYMPCYESATAVYLQGQRFCRRVIAGLASPELFQRLLGQRDDSRSDASSDPALESPSIFYDILKQHGPMTYGQLISHVPKTMQLTFAEGRAVLYSDRRFIAITGPNKVLKWQIR